MESPKTGKLVQGANDKRLFDQIGRFLAEHGLPPRPENYALVYELFTNIGSSAADAVRAATTDGIRLTQKEADRIIAEHGLSPERVADAADSAAIQQARKQIADFASVVDATRLQAQSYGADLERGAAELQAEADGGSVAGLLRITTAMLERTRFTEKQLVAAREEAQRLREQLAEAEEEARSDTLTELPNRRAFEDRLAEVEAAGQSYCLAICDIDRFKRINDTHGHGVGDRVLKMVAGVLDEACAPHLVARLGGEEFVVLFTDVAPEAAAALLDDARAELGSKHFRVRETDQPLGKVTFSAGIAAFDKGAAELPLKRADNLLYAAKDGGRDRVIWEGQPLTAEPVQVAAAS